MKIFFCCFGDAGLNSLKKLLKIGFNKTNLFCATHKSVNNKKLIQFIERKKIKIVFFNPNTKIFKKTVLEFKPDLFLSIYYRLLIPYSIISLAKYSGINMHPSYLPYYKGAFSNSWAIINGEKFTGITFHYMTDKIDSWIWYYDTIYKRTKRLTLGVFLNKINNRTLVNDATRVYFSTEKELEEFKNKYYKTDWSLV